MTHFPRDAEQARDRMRKYQNRNSALYNHAVRKNVIHISESEVASDFSLVMTRVREGRKSSSNETPSL